MKPKLLIMALLAGICHLSCTKENNTSDAGKERNVRLPISFNLKDFIQRIESLDTKQQKIAQRGNAIRGAALRKITDINYLLVPKATGEAVKRIHQNIITDSAHFGDIVDTVYSDNYYIYLLASDTAVKLDPALGTVYLRAFISTSNMIIPFKDLFYTKIDLNIDRGFKEPQNVTLNRIVANLQVEVLDGGVNPDYDVFVDVEGEHDQIHLLSLNFYKGILDYNLRMDRRSHTLFSNNILNTTNDLKITITAKHKTNGQQIQKIVKNVRCYKNKTTTVTGSLNIPGAPVNSGKDFKVMVKDNWDPNNNNINF